MNIRKILKVRAAYFLVSFWLLSGETLPVVAAEGSTPSAIEEELLVTTHPVGHPSDRLVVALRAEPKTFNPVIFRDEDSQTVIRRLMADLIHINRLTQETEIALAKSWTVFEDGRRYQLKLRRGIRFSDGHLLDADDVLFSFSAYLDEKVGSPQRDALIVGGKPIQVTKIDRETLEFEFAEPYAVGERLFDSLAILPQHILEESYRQGKLSEAWQLTTPEDEIVGLGPYRLKEYIPGERCVLVRNPYYWKVDQAGQRLPYFNELVFLFVADDDSRMLRFRVGDLDVIDRLSADDYLALERDRRTPGLQLVDRGAGLAYHFLFFNLNDLEGRNLAGTSGRQSWFRQLDFRRAVSRSIDRAGIVRLVFKGRASPLWSHVTPGLKHWVNPQIPSPPRSISDARRILSDAGYTWDRRNQLIDPSGRPVEFSLIVNSGNSQRQQMAAIVQNDLSELGMTVRIVPMEHRALVDRITRSYDYDACLLGLSSGDTDPNPQLPVLLSSGSLHLWHLGQEKPATPWEAEIDRLMKAQSIAIDPNQRRQLFNSVQELMAENLPMLFLASPHVLVGAQADIGNFDPAVLDSSILWNVEQLYRHEVTGAKR